MDLSSVLAYARGQRGAHLDSLVRWCRIPSISSAKSHADEVRHSAEHLLELVRNAGASHATIWETAGHPAVFAEWKADPSAPTVLVYGHHDVQPIDPLNEWHSPPFEPTVRDGRLYGRGVVDDKGQVLAHVHAIESFLRTLGRLPVNVKMIVEGEEEIGSHHLAQLLSDHRDELRADLVVVSDTAMFGRGIPSLCVGLRGMAYFEVELRTLAMDVHSGSFGGGVRNAARELCVLLGGLHDPEGRVTIPGFYQNVRALDPSQRAALARLPFDEGAWLRAVGASAAAGEAGHSTLERIWTRPTLEVCGLTSGFQGEGSKTIVPATAKAKVSCRLVADQEPTEIAALFEAHVRKLCPPGVAVEVRYLHGGRPWVADESHPVFDVARRALSAAFGAETVSIREGGSIPFVRTIADATGKPCLLLGFGQPDENAHAPNEWLDLENYFSGTISIVHLYAGLAP